MNASCSGREIDLKYAATARAMCKLGFWFQRIIYGSSP